MAEYLHFLDEVRGLPLVGDEPLVSVVSAPLDKTTSWMGGTGSGPAAILEASQALEPFDDELLVDIYTVGIDTLPPLSFHGMGSAEACGRIQNAVSAELGRGRLPVLLGGEHTVTVPAVRACREKYPDLHVLQIDAHLDLRDRYENDPLSHACVMRRLHEEGVPITQAAIRSFCREEWDYVTRHKLEPFTMARIRREPDWIWQICRRLEGPVYITFDVDGLDPAVVPSTGTPEPNGLLWHEAMQLVAEVSRRTRVVGLDFVELIGQDGAQHAAYSIAKLLYRSLGYIFHDTLIRD